MTNEFDIALLEQNDFFSLRKNWTHLLKKSCADDLFCSWEWQYSWWDTWGEKLNLDLYLVEVKKEGELFAILPLFLDTYCPAPTMQVRRLQFIGNHWRSTNTVRSEYLGPIIENENKKYLIEIVTRWILNDKSWDELLICDQRQQSGASLEFGRALSSGGCRKKKWNKDFSYQVNTSIGFHEYLKAIGRNTRLKLYNRRKLVVEDGVDHKKFSCNSDFLNFFDVLNSFHVKRWGKVCFDSDSVRFHQKLLHYIENVECHLSADLSCLENESGIVSVLYNIKSFSRMNNIQSGYLEQYDKRVSLGTLHLGYAIEQCCNDTAVDSFDLLAGYGKNSNYKASLTRNEVVVQTISYVRSPVYKTLLACYDALPKYLGSRMVRLLNVIRFEVKK